MNYYNEHDPKAAAWLRGLIAAGLIPAGVVDERSISDVLPTELSGYTQCHFFAGIGGWSLALALAGWPTDRQVWTGSCPCQPFSSAGKQMGRKDPRHLWPAFRRLINRCRPPIVFGEQVASADGRKWLAGVFANLETMGYAAAGLDLCAAGVTAPHIRQRLYWVADSQNGDRWSEQQASGTRSRGNGSSGSGQSRGMGDSTGGGLREFRNEAQPGSSGHANSPSNPPRGVADMHGDGLDQGRSSLAEAGYDGPIGNGLWSDSTAILCRDGKYRRIPTEPALFPLADGLPYKLARRGSVRPALLKGAGNAIVPQVAAEFILAWLEAK